jgi:uncharacterized RDD family membrane protein YckC
VSQLITGEAVALDLRPARLPSRILARGIDVVIELVGLGILLKTGSAFITLGDSDFAAALAILLLVVFVVGYPLAFESLWRGLTPGKAALGIRVVRDDGGPVRFRHALTRGLFNVFDVYLSFGVVAVVSSLVSRTGKRLGDAVAGTFVIQERLPRQYVAPVYMPPPLASWASTLDLSRLPDDLALAVRGYLGRASQLRPEARDRLGADLAAAVASYVAPPPPPGAPGWAYLSAVVAERRRRDEARMPARSGGPGWPPAAPGASPPGPSPWQPPPPSHRWSTPPPAPRWGESAPPTGAPPPLGTPPPIGAPPPDPGPPRLPSAPSPQWGPVPVPPSAPPAAPAPSRATEPAASVAGRAPPGTPAPPTPDAPSAPRDASDGTSAPGDSTPGDSSSGAFAPPA